MRARLALGVSACLLLAACGSSDPTTPSVAAPTAAPTAVPSRSPTPVPVTVNGDWRSEARAWRFRLQNSGGTVTGVVLGFRNITYSNLDHPDLQITGTIDAQRNVAFRAGAFSLDFGGVMEPSGLRMTGTIHDCGNGCRNYGEILLKQ